MYRDTEQRDFARRMRNSMTPAERALWRALRGDQLRGFRFRRQAAIGPYIADFACFAPKLVVELDGPQHCEEQVVLHDQNRTAWLSAQGFRVLRFANHELDEGLHSTIDLILNELLTLSQPATPPLSPALSTREREPEGTIEAGGDQ